MKRIIIAALLMSVGVAAQSEVGRWLRNTSISPDGTTVAFTYKGDVFTVPVSGGKAKQITSNAAYDSDPIWSPDGKTIVFNSDRHGWLNLFKVSADGGTPVRLTTIGANSTPLTFLNDTTVLFSAKIMVDEHTSRGPYHFQTYSLNISEAGNRPELYLGVEMTNANMSKSGRLLYEDKKSKEDKYRKHERSSGTADIWLYEGGKFSKLTNFNGHDLNPVWKSAGDGYYYVSEEDGTLNVYSSSLSGGKKQLTHFTKHPVRSLSASETGVLAFSWDGDIYTMKEGSEPVKLTVEIDADQYDEDYVKDNKTSGATAMAVSPDGSEVAFVIRGDVYVTDSKYKTTKRITDTPWQERCVSFSEDGRTLVYDSDREGYWQLYTTTIKNAEEKQFAYATDLEEKLLYKCETSAQQPEYSPDGKKVAFLENRTQLRVIDVKTGAVTTALDGKYNYSYSDGDVEFAWSPDSEWLLASYIGVGGWNNEDIALVKADGSQVEDLTESGFSNDSPKWALDGKAVTFSTAKYGMKSHGSWGNQNDIILMALDQEAWDDFNSTEEEASLKEKKEKEDKEKAEKEESSKKKKEKKGKKEAVKPLEFDLANRKYRQSRLTERSALIYDYYLTPKGDKFYYIASATEGGANLIEHDLKEDESSVLIKGVNGMLMPDAKGENLFLLSSEGIKKIDLKKGSTEDVEFEAVYDRKPSKEREYMYDHMLRQVHDKFYDVNLHGVDWQYYGDHYREFLPYISNNRDFAIFMSEILGELNASHTGSGYRAPQGRATATLGAFYDVNYKGDGLKVSEVLPRGPLTKKTVDVKAGDLIMSIDGEKILAGKDYYQMLDGKKKVRLEVKRSSGKTDYVDVKTASRSWETTALYERWVERNQAYVDSISGGKVGYVHIKGMDGSSYNTIYDEILGKYRNCDALVVDTRFNGGGWLHNDVAVLLSGKEYVRFMPRGQYIGSEPFSQWYKPSVMLVNENNYSDAHGTPYTYQTLGIGEVVGAPIPGTMTAVWWETQIDPTLYFGIPQVANTDLNGKPLENQQLNPDIIIYNDPGDELQGHDAQLEGAVRRLLEKCQK